MENETGWAKQDILDLFSKVDNAKSSGRSLNVVFKEMSQTTNHKPNSIRNFYYNFLSLLNNSSSLREEYGINPNSYKKVQFELFTNEEIDELVKNVLVEYKKGKSVRRIINELAGGDRQKMLRLQNKYRSMILNHRDRVETLMAQLKTDGIDFFNPYESFKSRGKGVFVSGDVLTNMYRLMNELSVDNDINLNLALNLTKQMMDIIVEKITEKATPKAYEQMSFDDILNA